MTPKNLTFVAALVFVGLGLAACVGLDLGDVVRVKTPHEIQQTEGLPARQTLNEAEQAYQAWFEDVQRSGAAWRASIERGDEIRGLLGQLTLGALNDLGPAIAGVPVLGPALPVLSGLAGLFIGSGRLRREKEASFNKGLEKGSQTAKGAA